MKLCITGANSSVGRNLLEQIGELQQHSAVACVRSIQVYAQLPLSDNITPFELDYQNHTQTFAACRGTDAIVHLAGVLFEGKHSTYQSANVDSTAAMLSAAQAAGVGHFVFISVLGADPAARNPFYRSKGQAEQLLLNSDLAVTIIRTPLLLSPESAGGKALLREARSGKATLLGGGRHRVQPLDVDDLSAAILAACDRPNGKRVLELCGPERVPYHQLVTQVAAHEGRSVQISAIPIWLAKLVSGMQHAIKGVDDCR